MSGDGEYLSVLYLAITKKIRTIMKVLIIKNTVIYVLLFVSSVIIIDSSMRPTRLGSTYYYLASEPTGLYYEYPDYGMIGVLNGRITDVYWNEEYILATQCGVWNDSIEGYYLVKMLELGAKRGVPCEIIGSLSREEYEQNKSELSINEQKMRHINLFDSKHKLLGSAKFFAVICILLTLAFYVFRSIFIFKNKKHKNVATVREAQE